MLILKSHSKSAAQIFKKQDRRFPHGAGRLDSNWLEDEASAQLGVLGDFHDFNGVGDGSSGERGSWEINLRLSDRQTKVLTLMPPLQT